MLQSWTQSASTIVDKFYKPIDTKPDHKYFNMTRKERKPGKRNLNPSMKQEKRKKIK